MKFIAIYIKNLGKDEHGMRRFIYATTQQADYVCSLRNDANTRQMMVRIGSLRFCPADVAFMEERDLPEYELPKYFLDRKKLENENIETKQLPSH